MPTPTLVRQSVLKHALFNQYNVILMGGMALLSAASGSTTPLLVAGAGEILWLMGGARSPRFRQWIAPRGHQRDEQRWWTTVEAAAVGIDPVAAPRLRATGGALLELSRACNERGEPQLTTQVDVRLHALLSGFAALVSAQQRLAKLMGAGGAEAAESELAQLTLALADEKDSTVRISLRQAVALAHRRLKRFAQVESMRRDLMLKMSTFDSSVEFVCTQVRGGESEDQILLAITEIEAGARFDAHSETEATRALGDRHTMTRAQNVAAAPDAH
jgi:hypothetical protein